MKDHYSISLSLKDITLMRDKRVALGIYESDLLRLDKEDKKSGLLNRNQKFKIHVKKGSILNIKKRFI